jgi:hypothetical protein
MFVRFFVRQLQGTRTSYSKTAIAFINPSNNCWLRAKFCPNKKVIIETATLLTKYLAILSASFVLAL